MFRTALGVVAGVLVGALAGLVAAHGTWSASTSVNAGIVTAGDYDIAATWSGSTPTWSALLPGTVREARLEVSSMGEGTTLGWRLHVQAAATGPLAPYTVTVARECGAGVIIGASGYPVSGTLPAGAAVAVCVSTTLAADAPSALQGQTGTLQITVTGRQVLE